MARIRPHTTVAGLVAACCVLGFVGPLFPFKPQPSDRTALVAAAPHLDRYLREGEAAHGVKPGLAKGIDWRDPDRNKKTPLSIVYLHGFSASRKDISPVVERLAARLEANAFFTRLAAHGLLTSSQFETVRPEQWMDDAREALAIGRRIGDCVLMIGTSTGAPLALMAALEDQSSIAGLVMLSPNFGLTDWRARYLSGPLGPWLAAIAIGHEFAFLPENDKHADFWTSRYSSRAIAALMDLVNGAASLRLDQLRVPTLVIYTSKDAVVDPNAIRARYDELTQVRKRLIDLPGAFRHELTGDALSPQTVDAVITSIADFMADITPVPRAGGIAGDCRKTAVRGR